MERTTLFLLRHLLIYYSTHRHVLNPQNAKTKPSKENDSNHRNNQTKITKPPKHSNKTTETSDKTSEERVMYVIHCSFVLVVTFVSAVSCQSFRFDGFVFAFLVLVHDHTHAKMKFIVSYIK